MNDTAPRQPLAAIFSTRDAAHAAAEKLHDAGMTETWIGVTHAHDVALDAEALSDARGGNRGYVPDAAVGSTLTGAMMTDAAVHDLAGSGETTTELVVEDESDSLLDKMGRFFSGTGDLSLYDALIEHGVSEADAHRLESAVVADDAILLVDAAATDTTVQAIVEDAGGRLLTGMTPGGVSRTRTLGGDALREDRFVERPRPPFPEVR